MSTDSTVNVYRTGYHSPCLRVNVGLGEAVVDDVEDVLLLERPPTNQNILRLEVPEDESSDWSVQEEI